MVVDGQTTIYDSLIIESDNEVFNINNGSSVTQFSVDFDNGNTVIGRTGQGTGTLTVHGASTFNNPSSFTDNVTIGNANTDTLTVNSVSTFTDNVTVNGNFDVDGNAIIEGNLTVNGTTSTVNSTVTTLDDPVITLGGDTALPVLMLRTVVLSLDIMIHKQDLVSLVGILLHLVMLSSQCNQLC